MRRVVVVAALLCAGACEHAMGEACGPTATGFADCGPGYRCEAYPQEGVDDLLMCVPCSDQPTLDALGDLPPTEEPPLIRECFDPAGFGRRDAPVVGHVFVKNTSDVELATSELTDVEGHLVIVDNGLLEVVDLPNLRSVGGRVVITGNRRLTTIAMPLLVHGAPIVMRDDGTTCEDAVAADLCADAAACACGDPDEFVDQGF